MPNPGLAHFLASMGSSTRSPATHLSPNHPQSPATTKNIPQAPVPLDLQVAIRTIRQLHEYDASVSKLRARYADALERERRIGNAVDDRRQSTAAGLGAERRRSSIAALDAARDPRLTNTAAAAHLAPAPTPASAPAVAQMSNAMDGDAGINRARDPRRRPSIVSTFEPPPSSFDHRAHEIDAQRDPRRR